MDAPRRILVIDDAEVNRRIIKGILYKDYEIIEADNGQSGLNVLKDIGETISLILLDVIMPVMDGYTMLDIIKKDPLFSTIPVIITTQNIDDEIKALAAGATDFISKPYKAQILKHRVISIIHLRESASMVNLLKNDHLTGLYGKEFFFQKVKGLITLNSDKRYDLVCSDIQNFKLVNDIYGSKIGDELLCYVAQLLKTVFSDGYLFTRFNSDVFMLIRPHRESYDRSFFDNFIAQLNEFHIPYKLQMKFGIYFIEDQFLPVSAMCDRALLAVDTVRNKYDASYAYYDDTLRQRLLAEQIIIDNMEQSLQDHQFHVYLQPKYNVKNEKIAGAEALVRWIHPTLGFMSPGEFIPLFEKNGFITKLDQFIWEESCRIIRNWIDEGIPCVPISVNVSRADVYNLNLPEVILSLVQKYNIEPYLLHLEVTESAYTEDPQQIIATIGVLRELGFVIEMDDFGTGYSSLSMLSQLPIDVLKLDMSFIRSELAKDSRHTILSFIISLAKWMDLQVISEGVETQEQLDRLRDMDCNYVQGYFFAKPMPEKDFTMLLLPSAVDVAGTGGYHLSSDVTVSAFSDNKRVMLIVDDIEVNRSVLKTTLEPFFNIVEADNGSTAYEYIMKNPHSIAVMLIDLVMPVMDGFQLIEKIKQNPELSSIPILVTSQGGEGKEAKAVSIGANDFIAKPYDMQVILSHVQRVMRISELERRDMLMNRKLALLKSDNGKSLTRFILNNDGFDDILPYLTICKDLFTSVIALDLDLPSFSAIENENVLLRSEILDLVVGGMGVYDVFARLNNGTYLIISDEKDIDAVILNTRTLVEEIMKCKETRGASSNCFGGIAITKHTDVDISVCIDKAVRKLADAQKINDKSNCVMVAE